MLLKLLSFRPNEQDVHPYLISIGRINAALDHLNQFKLKSAERVQSQLKQILKAALYQLESLFRRWLQQNSTPVDVLTYQEGKDHCLDVCFVLRGS